MVSHVRKRGIWTAALNSQGDKWHHCTWLGNILVVLLLSGERGASTDDNWVTLGH